MTARRQMPKLRRCRKLAVQACRAAVPRPESFGPDPNGENRPIGDVRNSRCRVIPRVQRFLDQRWCYPWLCPPNRPPVAWLY